MIDKYQKGFGLVVIIVIVITLGAVGFVGWKLYKHTLPQNENKKQAQSANNSNLVTEYFAPANVSFTHDRRWSYDTRDLTKPVDGRPSQKATELKLPYQGGSDISQSLYTIRLSVDDMFIPTDPNYDYKEMGQISLNEAKAYILLAQGKPSSDGDSFLELSSCPDKSCPLKLGVTASVPYFEMVANKGTRFPLKLDDSMIPELITILKSLKVGQP